MQVGVPTSSIIFLTIPCDPLYKGKEVDRKRVILIACVVEAGLAAIFFIWAAFTGFRDKLYPSLSDVGSALVLAAALGFANYALFGH